MTFDICVVYHSLFVPAGKMTEGSRITPPHWAESQLHHHWRLAELQEGTSTHLQLLFPACSASSSLLWAAFTDHTVPQEGEPLQHSKEPGMAFTCSSSAWRVLLAVQGLGWGSSPPYGATSPQTKERAEGAGAGGNVLELQSPSVAVIIYS